MKNKIQAPEHFATISVLHKCLNIKGPNHPLVSVIHMLVVHVDFFASYPLARKIKEYGFFSYATNEALHLSEQEEDLFIQQVLQ
ncbi:hypothetical protein [Pedobacter gandavensis]|uniref:Uncharacterized protein n=1 Tax=Pedobacter gandavensis TaxID=2679963 RepID=A0ABR6EQF5_9SPHI|nr:hypothetical protein [Pedobacter gandavensis]MBB2147465.1 hypothetical protein [Pedobacter gandavensis]